jgi:hypothetical protein
MLADLMQAEQTVYVCPSSSQRAPESVQTKQANNACRDGRAQICESSQAAEKIETTTFHLSDKTKSIYASC